MKIHLLYRKDLSIVTTTYQVTFYTAHKMSKAEIMIILLYFSFMIVGTSVDSFRPV